MSQRNIFWAIVHGDPELTSVLYWTGYDRTGIPKNHRFSADVQQAIRFCREEDAQRAGVHLTKGIKVVRCTVYE